MCVRFIFTNDSMLSISQIIIFNNLKIKFYSRYFMNLTDYICFCLYKHINSVLSVETALRKQNRPTTSLENIPLI